LPDVIEYYAKSTNGEYTETLFSHLLNTLALSKKLIKTYEIYDKQLIKAIRVAWAFHDIGKADHRFQRYMLDNEPKVYHPLLGLPVIWKVAESLDDNLRSLVTLSVASHHTALHHCN
jgi:CRISPR-associated endonuclease Cas3-HD